MAVLSHFLHNHPKEVDTKQKEEIISAVREFLSRKEFHQGNNDEELSDNNRSRSSRLRVIERVR